MANFHKVRCCYVIIESIHGTETYLVPSRDNAEAAAQFFDRTRDANVKAYGNFQLEPMIYDDGTRFEFNYDGRYHYFEPGVPGYSFLSREYQGIAHAYENHRQNEFDA